MRLLRIMVVMLFGFCAVRGQEAQRTAEGGMAPVDSLLRRNTALVFFERNLNTYNWVGRAAVDTSFDGTRTSFVEQYSTNMIRSGSDASSPLLSTGQQNVSLLLSRPITPDIAFRTAWTSMIYTDNRGLGLGNASSHAVLAGVALDPLPLLSVTPMAGYRWDRQSDLTDRGPVYAMGALMRGLDLDGYEFSGSGQYRLEQLTPRRLETDYIHTNMQKEFSPGTRDTLEAGFTRTQREIYLQPTGGIESRLDQIFSFNDLLQYEIDRGIHLDLFIAVYNRTLDKSVRGTIPDSTGVPQFDTRIDEFRLDTYAQLGYRTDDQRLSAMIRLGHSERNETHLALSPGSMTTTVQTLFGEQTKQEQSKDNLARRTTLAGVVDVVPTRSDRFSIAGSVSILRYDTPSSLNLEDRDELLAALTLATSHHISRDLDAQIILDGSLSHLVYLLAERSANNTINRIIRLTPRTVWSPRPWMTSVNAFEVLANYTVYDFEAQLASARSFSYRQWGWMDSTRIEVTDRIGVDFFSYLKFYERGELRWSEFTERPENSFSDRTYAGQIRFTPFPEAMFAVGVRYFSQTRYAYVAGFETLDQFVRSVGPTFALVWKPGPSSMIAARGWYESRRQPDGTKTPLTTFSLNLTMNF